MPTLEMATGFEGANPQDAARIERLGEAAFRVCPESEDGDSNYKFACNLVVTNPDAEPATLALTIDWQEPPEVGTRYMGARDTLFVLSGADWRELTGEVDEDRVRFEVPIPSGTSRVCMAPPYGPTELEQFFERVLRLPGASRRRFGQTAEDRPLEAAVLPSEGAQDLCVVAIGALHPYETGGSYFVDGIAGLLSGSGAAGLRRNAGFVLVPLGNPDGTAHGYCKRTTTGCDPAEGGNTSADPTACALRGLLCGVSAAAHRAAYVDAHNWMIRHDGLYVYRKGLAEKMEPALQGDLFPAGWEITDRSGLEADVSTPDLRHHAARSLGMETLVTSTSWFGRTPDVMRRIGAFVTDAFLKALASGR